MKTLKSYIKNLLSLGKYFFSREDALSDLGLTQNQLRFQAYRLSKKGVLKRLTNDFFMIISPEYFHLGSLPPQWVIDALMKHLGQDYYIGLLSAASLYGATEQQPMSLQVITTRATKDIDLGRGSIEFHVFRGCLLALKSTITLPTGYVNISTREQTIIDLVRFYDISGYLSNVALVIKSLAEGIDPQAMALVIKNETTKPVLQRLGYIFELLTLEIFANMVEKELATRKIEYVLLRPDFHGKNGSKNKRWKLIVNDSVEIE
jgi:predicted transcriptional regulator of viral defense system